MYILSDEYLDCSAETMDFSEREERRTKSEVGSIGMVVYCLVELLYSV